MNLLQRVRAWSAGFVCALALVGCSSSNPEPLAGKAVPAAPLAPPPATRARHALVLLSGGGTPFSNHYSQYVQAKALTAFFERAYPDEPTWIFFGMGNRPDAPPELADAHRLIVRDGLELDAWEPGVLRGNRAATRANFLRALREEILPTVRDGGTLHLFIGDHGELTKPEEGESAITLWQFKRGSRRRGAWFTDEKELLTVTELRQALAEGLGQGRVIFCMTQCHSGGFHYLGVPREMPAPRNWFATAPEWLRAQRPPRMPALRVAGFTATDEDSLAAGCVSDPDPERWAGYERFAPESVIGVDLMTERALSAPRLSLAAAHEAATLVDATIDKPRATSEQYLERWAHLIENRLAHELRVTEKTRAAVAAYQRTVDTGSAAAQPGAAADFRARQEQFRRYIERLAQQNEAARDLLLRGTRQQLEEAMRARGGRGGPRGGGHRRGMMTEARRAWNNALRPAWKAAVQAPGTLLAGPALEFETHLLTLEEDGRNFLLPRGSDEDAFLSEVYWKSTYAEPQKLDRAKAEAVTRWAAERADRILAWARASADPGLRDAAEKIAAALESRAGPAVDERAPASTISRRTAAERVLFYRRVLGAWEFLIAMDARPELARLQELIEIERTPLPTPKA